MSLEIKQIQQEIKEIEDDINAKLTTHPNYPLILIFGLTGSGKSSLACCLTNKQITIDTDDGDFPVLKGERIFSGSQCGTEKPLIYVDDVNKLIFCDCPGFEDLRGQKEEIINSFADDYLLVARGPNIQLKILLVVSESEFNTGRGEVIYKTFKRMNKMFSDPYNLKKGVGFIISKGVNHVESIRFFKKIEHKAKPNLKKWCDYFISHEDQIFKFPLAKKKDAGKKYDFFDHDRLIKFLKSDYLNDPPHSVSVSEDAIGQLKIIRIQNIISSKQILENFFMMINDQYRKFDNSNSIDQMLSNMKYLLTQRIVTSLDFQNALIHLGFNKSQYGEYIKQLAELEALNSFIDRIPEMQSTNSCIEDTIRILAKDAIEELSLTKTKMKQLEISKKEIQQKDLVINQCKATESNLKNTVNALRNDINNHKNQINQMQKSNEDACKRFQYKIDSERKRYEDEATNLKNKIDDYKRRNYDNERELGEIKRILSISEERIKKQ